MASLFHRPDPAVPCLESLPEWAMEQSRSPRVAWGVGPEGFKKFHFCPECNGWIEGDPFGSLENTAGPLAGRSGWSHHCRRCRTELSFCGKQY